MTEHARTDCRPASSEARSADRYPVPAIRGVSTRRFAAAVGASVLLWLAAWPFLTLGFLNHYGSGDAAWVEALYQPKDSVAKRPAIGPGGRIVIVGGSNALFGIDAELIERKLGVTTINYATHAGLGGYILDRARSAIHPGDTVLLCPEYELWYNKAADFTDVEWEYVCTYDKSYVWSQGAVPALRMLYSQPGEAYKDALRGWQYYYKYVHKNVDGGHGSIVLDECGDLRVMPAHRAFLKPWSLTFPDPKNPGCAIGDFGRFASWARANHVRVLLSWPNICDQAWPGGAPPGALTAPAATRALLNDWGFIPLNEPSDTIYPCDWFTDTPYHTDAGCRRVRTEALIRRLRPYLGLPAANPPGQGVYLVGGTTESRIVGKAFTDRPDVQVKYLAEQPLDCPDAITPVGVADLAARGVPIWLDDPAIRPMLPAKQWDFTEVEALRDSLSDWLARYDHHIFLLACAGSSSSASAKGISPDVSAALSGSAPVVAVVGTGRWAGARRLKTAADTTSINIRADVLVNRDVPRVWLIAAASAAQPGGAAPESRIQINARTVVAATSGSIAVAVVDPAMGTLADAGTFQGTAPRALVTLWRLSLRQSPARAPER